VAITRADLVAAFPEFGNETVYPQTQIDFWLQQATKLYSETRLGASHTLAVLLFVAHNIVLSARAANAGVGGAAGLSLAPVTSKSVGGVSKSMDVSLTAYAGAGPYNATPYGQRLYGLLRSMATGPRYSVHPAVLAVRFGRRFV